jgi:serine/threonine protein kinase
LTEIQQALEEGDPLVGQTFEGRFQIISVLGQGGMGMVYKARHVHMDKLVAIKTLVPAAVSDDKSFLRFEQEAKAASNLQHPNIISIFDFGRSAEGTAYLVMEFLEGKTLEDELVMQMELISLERFERIFTQVCSGMQHAHKKGVIHRDIKPSNLMLVDNEDGKDFVKIVDFGLAKLNNNEQAQQHLTQTGMVMGSPPFMSPEQCRGEELDHRTDIYSLGCVMYAALTGQVPHMGNNSMATIYKHITDAPLPISEVFGASSVPPRLEDLVMKTLLKNREERPQSMEELGKALSDAIRNPGFNAATKPKNLVGADLSQAAPIKPMIAESHLARVQNSTPAEPAQAQRVRTMDGGETKGRAPKKGTPAEIVYIIVAVCFLSLILGVSALKHSSQKLASRTIEQSAPPQEAPASTQGTAASSSPVNPSTTDAGKVVSGEQTTAATASPVNLSTTDAGKAVSGEQTNAASSSASAVPAQSSGLSSIQMPIQNHALPAASNKSATTQKVPLKKVAVLDLVQQKKHDALKKANDFREQGRLAYDKDDLPTARLFFEKYRDELSTAYGAQDSHLLHAIGRILSCTKGQEDEESLKDLQLAMKIVGDERKVAFDTVKSMPSPSGTWRSLAWACLASARAKTGTAKRNFAEWAEYFYDYAIQTWDEGKNDVYYKVLRGWANAALLCGDFDKVKELHQQFVAEGQPFIKWQPPAGPGDKPQEGQALIQRANRMGKHRPFQNW